MRIWPRRMELKMPLRKGQWLDLPKGAVADVYSTVRMGPEQGK